ncbi:M56 family metallopeptidase [Flavobacterium cerinum]|uniref:M56 family metallopeptidase n=1 Tax=Flavobacterium cerinum TaxID=2502784 RepID=A0A3S3QK74_9FLAO|nr:M56 family metallopeptidase [Flavobacterium cerinum]RWW98807.1 M56 family metallopeptidase [Flavobacterium cerinum]
MENFIIYMAKASGLLALFFLAYYFLLRKETFFTSNRWFMLAGLVTSVVLPAIEYTKIIWITAAPQSAQPINLNQLIFIRNMLAAKPQPQTIDINWFDVAAGMYFAGVLFLLIRFTLDLLTIRKLLSGNEIVKDKQFRLIDSHQVKSPFSFFNYIIYNSAVLNPDELNSIISHEKVHSSQKHSIDMIISQLFCVAFWFNPFAWMYKKSISQNLEFIADAEAIKQLADRTAYQKTLLKITIQPECIAITNHFYQSLIKKRIVMLNKKQSKRLNSWKYATVLPALVAFMFLFQVKIVAQEKAVTMTTNEKTKLVLEITKDATDSELDEQASIFKNEFDADVIYSDLKRNAAGEITGIKVTVKDKNQSKIYQVLNNKPIVTFTIGLEKNDGSDKNYITFTGTNMRMSSENNTADSTIPNPPVAPPMPPSPPALTAIAVNNTTSNRNNNQGGTFINTPFEGAIVYINGVKQKESDIINIPNGQTISIINVLSPKEAKKKYGKEAKKGAMEITTQKSTPSSNNKSGSYSYALNNSEIIMPNLDEIMGYAAMGVNEGMKALSAINWDNEMQFSNQGLSAQDIAQLKADIKQAQADVKREMGDIEMKNIFSEKDKEEFKRVYNEAYRESFKAMKEMKNEIRENVKEEMKEAKKEMIKAKKEMEKARKEISKKSN